MLAPTAKTKRILELIQLGLTFVSVCAVIDASRIHSPPDGRAGYSATVPGPRETSEDRRIGDLARVERTRREAEQRASRRGLGLGHAIEKQRLPA
jgi:hypothetical protein